MNTPQTTAEYLQNKNVEITDYMGSKHEGTVMEVAGSIIKLHYLHGGNVTFTEPDNINHITVKDGK
jgi:hypothetical protein